MMQTQAKRSERSEIRSHVRLFALLSALLIISACSSVTPTQTAALSTPVVQSKLLATLFISPTPNEQEQDATRLAVRINTPTPAPTDTPAPTAYIGVFMGDAQDIDGGSVANTEEVQGTVVIPTLGAPGCAYPIDPVFGTGWTSNSSTTANLGCAGEPSNSYVGTTQIFEHGVMYWIPSGDIWAISASSGIDGRFWHVDQAPPDQGWKVPAPNGLQMPQNGFGAVWKAVDGVRQTLGFARVNEQSASLAIQRFDKGALIRDETAGQTFLLVGTDDGSAYGPY